MRRLLCSLLCVIGALSPVHAEDKDDSAALQLFEERIMPIFRSDKPSSCVQCHLSSVDIKDYILPSHTETFVALREQGLVNPDAPEDSKILSLIRMGDKDKDAGARLIHEKTRQAEFEAFSSWIKACCNDPELRAMTIENAKSVGPDKPLEVVRHARKSRIVDSFARNIWSQRMRCFPCHTPHEIDESNPQHKIMLERHGDFTKEFGLKMNIFLETPEATLDHLIASSSRKIPGRYPLINLEDPAKSLLLLKPTSKLPQKNASGEFDKPSSKDPVSHMGGLKMHVDDQSYKSFMAWLQDYANVAGDRYVSVDDLPADNWLPTQRILRMRDLPASWGDLTPVQLFVHAPDADNGGFSAEPIAFTQGLITPKRIVNGALFVFRGAADNSPEHSDGPLLKPGRYLIKAYVDRDGKLSKSPALLLGAHESVGEAEIEAHWQIGFPKAEAFSANDLK